MANVEYCFFCCKSILLENCPTTAEVDSLNYSLDNLRCDVHTRNKIGSEAIKEDILRISHYLKVPRTLINYLKDTTSIIHNCTDCSDIIDNLGGYCGQLEIIKMKISYHLKRLGNVIESCADQSTENYQRHLPLSTFQKIIHQKCLLKVGKDQLTRSPEILLSNLESLAEKIRPKTESEDVNDQISIKNEPVSSDLLNNQLIIQELHSCPFCTFVVNGPSEQLQSHMTTEHPEHFQPSQDETPSVTLHQPDDHHNECNSSLLLPQPNNNSFKCKKCGKVFTLRKNLRRHFKISPSCAQDGGEHTQSFLGNFKCSNCNRRYRRRDHLKWHLNNICKIGKLINIEKGEKSISMPSGNCTSKTRNTFSQCKYCGMLVYSRNLQRHVDYKHGNNGTTNLVSKRKEKFCEHCSMPIGNVVTFRAHMLEEHGIKMLEKGFKCETCGRSYELKSSWRRHFEKSERCRFAFNEGEIKSGNQVEKEGNKESGLVFSMDELDEDKVMITNDVKLTIEEDPLAI